ncbi:MAG TPA: tetratricopeptide repeat protein, partial [Gemmatimonadales bacterium]|nr:tetratricopeptide repeat protein [Gemmatimonadales bacterium]
MALSEIEKLERRYAENPQGLTFAPLAEIHRKNGDVARALELLRLGLELHPDYIPASIVLGRCHLDLGDLPAAETAFTHVLGLDGENVIALKSLADISERQHHFDEAERWLRTLLSVDRSNDEARAQLERIETARRDAAFAPPPPTPMEEEVEAPAGSAPAAAAESEAAPEPPTQQALPTVTPPAPEPIVPVEPWVSPAADEAVLMPLEDLEPALLSDVSEPPPPGLQTEEPETVAEPVEPLLGLIGRDVDQPEAEEFRVELSEDIVLRSSGGNEFQVPDAAAELSDRMPMPAPSSPFGEERAPGVGGLEEPPAPPAPEEPQPAAASAGAPEADRADAARWPFMGQRVAEPDRFAPAAEQQEKVPVQKVEAAPEPQAEASREPPAPIVVSEPEPDLVVTETMAEVLLHQGHSAEALRVYREL